MLEWIIYGMLWFCGIVAGAGAYYMWKLGLKKDALFFAVITVWVSGALLAGLSTF